ncbi:MAG TPA: C4-type zinc ribbon domain-containing protein [Candidatus Didemnitutus sp.]|nr:C4-type zinc ribbon domain-containing protein [Candidatus Didemnitutus sp.]
MAGINLGNLLVLQEHDVKREGLEQQLKAVPREIASVEGKIASEKKAIEEAKAEWHALESRKKLLETEIQSAEAQIAKYKTQQAQVRKNDEYQALTHEIETTTGQIGTLEEDEIKVMFSIDEARKKFQAAEALLKGNIAGHETRIRTLQGREKELQAEIAAEVAAMSSARPGVPEDQLRIYDRLAKKPGLPAVVPLGGGRCGGCHLKVPAHIEVQARSRTEIVTCDQCGRMVYWPS